jgi:asparagine synthase (glutamine-hydrolysing)
MEIFSDNIPNGVITLGHARLSIVDLHLSKQPLESDHGSVLIQNGQIYNYKSIKSEIRNYPWRTNGDGEVILALNKNLRNTRSEFLNPINGKFNGHIRVTDGYLGINNPSTHHISWVQELDGMWGFALWDSNRQELILCRDKMGIKPLFRTILEDGTLLFASEIKAFYKHPDFIRKPDINAIYARLAYEYSIDETTLFAGVTQVKPGTIETWSLDSQGKAVLTGISSYASEKFSPNKNWDPISGSKKLITSLSHGVQDRFMSDVPIGVVLSGGLDSSLIAALSHDASVDTNNNVPECWTVAGSEDNPDYIFSESVANHLDLKFNSKIINNDIFFKQLPKFSWHGEDLDISVLFWQPLFQEMSKHVSVGLCGQGADELHAGYQRYKNLGSHYKLVKSRLDSVDKSIDLSVPTGPGYSLRDKKIFHDNKFSDLFTTLEFEMSRGQLSNFQLRLADRHSMAFGVEARVPFLNYRHRQESYKVPLNWKLSDNNEKLALRKAAKLTELPEIVTNRPKMPAGTATTPSLLSSFMEELTPHAIEWSKEYGVLSEMLRKQPDMAVGIRLFHSLHMTDRNTNFSRTNLMDMLDDVGSWTID